MIRWSFFLRRNRIWGERGGRGDGVGGGEGGVDSANERVEKLVRSRFARSVRRSDGEVWIVREEMSFELLDMGERFAFFVRFFVSLYSFDLISWIVNLKQAKRTISL